MDVAQFWLEVFEIEVIDCRPDGQSDSEELGKLTLEIRTVRQNSLKISPVLRPLEEQLFKAISPA